MIVSVYISHHYENILNYFTLGHELFSSAVFLPSSLLRYHSSSSDTIFIIQAMIECKSVHLFTVVS